MKSLRKNKLQAQGSIRLKVIQQIDARLPPAQKALKNAQTLLQQFNQKHQVKTATNSSGSAAAAYNQAQQELIALQQQSIVIETRRDQIFKQLGVNEQEAKILATVSQSKEFKQLVQDLRQLENQYKRKQTQLTPQHPEMVELTRDISDLRQGLNSEIKGVTGNPSVQLNLLLAKDTKRILTSELGELETQRASIINRLQVLQTSLGTLKQNVVDLPKLEQQSQTLERQVSQAQSTLDSLLNQKKEINQALTANISEVSILTPAQVPTRKIAPYRRPLFIMGFITSLGMAGLAMGIAEIRDRSLKTVEDAEDFLGLKVLGIIPYFEPPSQSLFYDGDLQRDIPTIFSFDQPGSTVSEAFRMLYLNLKVIPQAQSLQSLAITSSIPQEGKSTIAANLASTIAQAGKTVLLVDGNLSHSFQSLIWNLPNDIGLSNILFSQTSFLLAVKPISNNLDILTSGSIRTLDRNPFESKQMQLFIANMSSRYDCVIFDLPAVNVSADASIISQLVDGVIFVSQPGKLDELNAAKAKTLLQRSKANLLGMILNGSEDPKDSFIIPQLNEDDEDDEDGFDSLDLNDLELLEGNDFSNLGLHHSQNSEEAILAHNFGQHSLPELETHLETLQSQWAASKRLLDNKEEEFIHLCHAKKDLEQQLNEMSLSLSNVDDREKSWND
ncbi:MAG: polysaccharide biosynthesis tyrosine autokinase [Acaryochloridaceae cyanobacterium RL_2_7]|nr:polysaccharide biosynthesis tyrosine autokinase [Acaryochloridaceae cyanobacterium RL_2_7]